MNIYSKLLSTFVLPSLSVLTQSKFWNYYQDFSKDSWRKLISPSPDDVIQKLNTFVNHAYENVLFYRDRMDSLGLKPGFVKSFEDFRRLPPTTKGDISGNFPDRITNAHMDSSTWKYTSTSGTIQRLAVVQDFKKRDYVRTTQLLAISLATGYRLGMKYMEIPPDICANVCGVSNTKEPNIFSYFMKNLMAGKILQKENISDLRGLIDRQLIYRRIELPSFGPEGLVQKPESLGKYIEKINAYNPYVVKAAPVYIYLLARHINKTGIKPPYIKGGFMPMGGSMTPFMKGVVESAFGCKLHEDYGCAELGGIAAECSMQNGLHPFNGLFYVEVVRNGLPVDNGELGKILITDLSNDVMPFIRYDIGDVGIVRKDTCKCGISSPRIEVKGRVQDCLIGAGGTVLTHDTIVDMLLERSDLLGFQLELFNDEEVYIKVVPNTPDKVNLPKVRQMLSGALKGNPRVDARIVQSILPERGGKFRFVKNNSKVSHDIF